MLTQTSTKSPCCKAGWEWEQFAGMRLYHTVGRRHDYSARCGNCGKQYATDTNGKVRKS